MYLICIFRIVEVGVLKKEMEEKIRRMGREN